MADPPDVVAVPVGAVGRRPASCLSVRSLESKEADWIARESGAVGEVRHMTPVSHGLRLRSVPLLRGSQNKRRARGAEPGMSLINTQILPFTT